VPGARCDTQKGILDGLEPHHTREEFCSAQRTSVSDHIVRNKSEAKKVLTKAERQKRTFALVMAYLLGFRYFVKWSSRGFPGGPGGIDYLVNAAMYGTLIYATFHVYSLWAKKGLTESEDTSTHGVS